MSESLDIWAQKTRNKFKNVSQAELNQVLFFRDPTRPEIIDTSSFFSAADGILMGQKFVDSSDEVVEIKGVNYKLKDVFGGQEFGAALVIDVFMTTYDVHINRMSYAGMVEFKYLEPILSYNLPMNLTNKDLVHHKFKGAYEGQKYLKYNSRMINKIYSPHLEYTYYIVQIGDDEIGVIQPFSVIQKTFYRQNQRFSFLRGGSHVELVLPEDPRYTFEFLVPTTYHVKAGLDRLVKIIVK
jgi:phosphatidylserine decarboxylase